MPDTRSLLGSCGYLGLLLALLLTASMVPAHQLVKVVIDGDTIILGTGEGVRLVGVDTPARGYE